MSASHWSRSRPTLEMAEATITRAHFHRSAVAVGGPRAKTHVWPPDSSRRSRPSSRRSVSVTPSTRLRFAMRILLNAAWLVLIVPGFLCGQTVAQTDSSPSTSDVGAEVKALREALLQTQQQVAAQQQEIEILKAQ